MQETKLSNVSSIHNKDGIGSSEGHYVDCDSDPHSSISETDVLRYEWFRRQLEELQDQNVILSSIGSSEVGDKYTQPGLEILALDLMPLGQKKGQIFIIAGHHPDEKMSQFPAIEFGRRLLSSQSPEVLSLRQNYQITIIPVVDIGQTNFRSKLTHNFINRDYGTFKRSESKAVADAINSRSKGVDDLLVLDLHEHSYSDARRSFFVIAGRPDVKEITAIAEAAVKKTAKQGHTPFPDTDHHATLSHPLSSVKNGVMNIEVPGNLVEYVSKLGGTAFTVESPTLGKIAERNQIQLTLIDEIIFQFITRK